MKPSSYKLAILGALLGSLAACERPQWVVFIGTDAPVPQLGDRLLVEVLDDQGGLACATCRRQFGVGESSRWPVSFGLAPESVDSAGRGLHVRARLYREDHADADGIPQSASLDALGRLPELQGITQVGLTLSLDCFSIASRPGDPAGQVTCQPHLGTLGPEPMLEVIAGPQEVSSPGTWAPGRRVPCPSDRPIPAGMVCIPGGIFVLGGTHSFPVGDALATLPERLVRIRPFAIDIEEFKVKSYYQQLQKGGSGNLPQPGSPMCTYSGTSNDKDNELPINCVAGSEAAAACAASAQKRLPTEAEWEYVAGNLQEESTFPWGADEDSCASAIIARGRTFLEVADPNNEIDLCRVTPDGKVVPTGPTAAGHPRDVTKLGVRNLGGNLSEWVADAVSPYQDPCWTPVGQNWLDSPRCTAPLPQWRAGKMSRGGSWQDAPRSARASHRNPYSQDGRATGVGFRCVRDL